MAGAVMDFQAYATLQDERYREIIDKELSDQNKMIDQLCTMRQSDRATERIGATGEAPQWSLFSRGQIEYAKFSEDYNSVATHREFCQGMIVTRRMYEADLSGIFKRGDRFRKIVRSGNVTRQVHAASILNTSQSVNLTFYTTSDQVPLISSAHTTRVSGVSTATGYSNIVVGDFNPTNFVTARIQMRRFRNDVGDVTDIVANEAWTSPENEPRLFEITKTMRGLDSNFGNMNWNYDSVKPYIWNRLTNTSAVYLCNEDLRKESVIWWDWIPVEYEQIRDFETKQIKWSGYGAWSVQVAPEWRWVIAIIPN